MSNIEEIAHSCFLLLHEKLLSGDSKLLEDNVINFLQSGEKRLQEWWRVDNVNDRDGSKAGAG
jgi:hypothetical protein